MPFGLEWLKSFLASILVVDIQMYPCDFEGPAKNVSRGGGPRLIEGRLSRKREASSDCNIDLLNARKKPKREQRKKRKHDFDQEGEQEASNAKLLKLAGPSSALETKKGEKRDKRLSQGESLAPSTSSGKGQEGRPEVWKWWTEDKKNDGRKWTFLEHKGPVFAPPYEPLPPNVKFIYNGKEMKLSREAEEVATFYSKMLDHAYTSKETFNKNFFRDWRNVMDAKEKNVITDLKKCDFRNLCAFFKQKMEERRAMSTEQKRKIKEENERVARTHGVCRVDGHEEKVGNFKIEPPGLFRGRGEHPKMGMLKKRVMPEDVIINCSKNSKWPVPPKGHKWKEVRHDNTVSYFAVTWLASWTENIQKQVKYIMLNPSSKLKGQMDWQKYEIARRLGKCIHKIREDYTRDLNSESIRIRQRAVALYLIDKLALRAGNEKDEDRADTVGCCSLRVEHVRLHPQKAGKKYLVVFDFPGKDAIRYYNEVTVDRRVFENLQCFMGKKKNGECLFDLLNTGALNKHLNGLMEGLTAKVFRTYNASWTLQQQLERMTVSNQSIAEKVLTYNRANRAVALLCNHQRSIPKTHEKSMRTLQEKLNKKKAQVREAEQQYKKAKRDRNTTGVDRKKKAVERLKEQLRKLEVQETDREENKAVALGTSKLNYLDPRISVAWCKKWGVPIEKIYNKTQRERFRWAMDTATANFVF